MNRPFDPRGTRIRRWGRILTLIAGLSWLGVAVPLRGQSTEQPDLKAAIAAYQAGELQGALTLLQGSPTLLNTHDSAVRSLYRGLIYFALGDRLQAEDGFSRAIRTEPSIRLDPKVHSPSRIADFDLVRARVVEEWRAAARVADSGGDQAAALTEWRMLLQAAPDDAEAASRIAAIEEADRLRVEREKQADAARIAEGQRQLDAQRQQQQGVTVPDSAAAAAAEPPAAERASAGKRNPGQALAMGLVVPGLGQLYAGRSGLGILALAGAGGAIAAGYLVERVNVDCSSIPTNNTCPPGDVLGETTNRPYLAPALATAAGITILAAIDGMLAARRANARVDGASDASGDQEGLRLVAPSFTTDGRSLSAVLVRLRFH